MFRGDKYGFIGVLFSDGHWRVRHTPSEGDTALKFIFTAQLRGRDLWRRFEVQVPH